MGSELGIEYGKNSKNSSSGRDVFAQGECDDVFLELMGHLGWHDDLAKLAERLPEQSRERVERFLVDCN